LSVIRRGDVRRQERRSADIPLNRGIGRGRLERLRTAMHRYIPDGLLAAACAEVTLKPGSRTTFTIFTVLSKISGTSISKSLARNSGHVREMITCGHSRFETEYRRKDGTIFPVELRTFLMRDESGNPVGMWAIIRDISTRVRAERELNFRNALLTAQQEATLDALIIVDENQKVISFNRRFVRQREARPARFRRPPF